MLRGLFLWALLAGPVLAGRVLAGPLPPDALDALPPADVVLLGEVHDNALHHMHQARAVASIKPKAIVFEMLTPEQAARATPEVRGQMMALDAAIGWTGSGWPAFSMYFPIFEAAPDAAIHGGAMPRSEVRRAFAEPLEAIFGPEAAAFGLALPLDPADQTAREAAQAAAHCGALSPELLPGFVAAQRLRDAALARAVRDALAATGGPVVLIAGTEHARRDVGVPAKLAQAMPEVRVLTIGQVERDPGSDAPFDLWIVTEAAPRGDPCAAFRLGG
jgi:uncharacterized iron-regulated protein